LVTIFSCSGNRSGLILLNYQKRSSLACKEKPSENNLNLLHEYYESSSTNNEEQIFSILDCDNAKLSRFLKTTNYLINIAKLSHEQNKNDYINYFIPKICLAKIDYEVDPTQLIAQFEEGRINIKSSHFFSCTNKKYKQILEFILKSESIKQ
jgi:hypothetical protein